jgi:D-glycero-D-manno-heptose 1,7-bisphosphate phosphatase
VSDIRDPAHRVRLADAPARNCAALFLDRDGTLIEGIDYLADPNLVRVFPGAADALRRFRERGYALVLVTNQSGIGRGLLGWPEYEAVAERLRALLAEEGVALDAELACGHGPKEGATCGWRKPAPGMFLEAARLLALDLARSLVVGDRLGDLEAGAAAGLTRFVHVATGHGLHDRADVRAWGRPVSELDDISALTP